MFSLDSPVISSPEGEMGDFDTTGTSSLVSENGGPIDELLTDKNNESCFNGVTLWCLMLLLLRKVQLYPFLKNVKLGHVAVAIFWQVTKFKLNYAVWHR